MSGASNRAESTARLSAPASSNSGALASVMPPMATSGTWMAVVASRSRSRPARCGRLGGRRKETAEGHVVGARGLGCLRQFDVLVARRADEFVLAEDDARFAQAAVIASQVHAVGVRQVGQPKVVVDDQRHAEAATQRDQFAGLFVAACDVIRFVTVLHRGDAAGKRRLDLRQQLLGVGRFGGEGVDAARKFTHGKNQALPSACPSCAQKKRSGMYWPMPGRNAAFRDS